LIKINIKLNRLLPFFLLFLSLSLFLCSCGKLKGQFAFKRPFDKGYRINPERLEFDSGKKLQWIYSFDKVSSRINVGVIILKKELSWVDVLSRADYVDAEKNIVYGSLEGYEPGDYKIVITEITDSKSRKLDECSIYLFSDSDDFN